MSTIRFNRVEPEKEGERGSARENRRGEGNPRTGPGLLHTERDSGIAEHVLLLLLLVVVVVLLGSLYSRRFRAAKRRTEDGPNPLDDVFFLLVLVLVLGVIIRCWL